MSSEWVAPIATAAVGIAGIGATWLTARGQAETQVRLQASEHRETRRKELRAERRRLYADLLGELSEIESRVLGRARSTTEEEAREASEDAEWEQETTHRLHRLYRLAGEIALVASVEVYRSTADSIASALHAMADTMEVRDGDSLEDLRRDRRLLETFMIRDLRISPETSTPLPDLVRRMQRGEPPPG